MGQSHHPVPASVPDAPLARHLGDLGRADERWQVFLETRPQGQTVAGRVHFLQGGQTRFPQPHPVGLRNGPRGAAFQDRVPGLMGEEDDIVVLRQGPGEDPAP